MAWLLKEDRSWCTLIDFIQDGCNEARERVLNRFTRVDFRMAIDTVLKRDIPT